MGCLLATIFVMPIIIYLFRLVVKINRLLKIEIGLLKQNHKYIPSLFVELNESKEVLRFFLYSSKWINRARKHFNQMSDNNFFADIHPERDNEAFSPRKPKNCNDAS